VLTELGFQPVVGSLSVEHVGPFAPDGPAEHLGIRINGQRLGFLRFQCPRGGHP
jgi:hypothetical protein